MIKAEEARVITNESRQRIAEEKLERERLMFEKFSYILERSIKKAAERGMTSTRMSFMNDMLIDYAEKHGYKVVYEPKEGRALERNFPYLILWS